MNVLKKSLFNKEPMTEGDYKKAQLFVIIAGAASSCSATFVDIFEGVNFTILGRSFTQMNIVFLFATAVFIIGAWYMLGLSKKNK